MHNDINEATEILLITAREYGSGNSLAGDVVAAAYRLVAVKIRENGYAELASKLEFAAGNAEKR